MNPDFTFVSTPKQIDPQRKLINNSQQGVHLVTADPLKQCAKFTSQAFQLSLSPKYSLFIMGLQMVCEPKSGGFMSGFDQAIGSLMIMASPVWGLLRLAVGLPCAVGGSVATAAVGVAYGAEKLGKGIDYQINQPAIPSKADAQKEELTKAFVERMQVVIKDYSYPQQCFFKENPAELISIVLIMVAFRSRQIEGKALNVQNEVLSESSIVGQDEMHKKYFKEVCELKYAIQSLRLSLEDNHAWMYLTDSLTKSAQTANLEKKLSSETQIEFETLHLLMDKATSIANTFVNDSTFQKMWKATL